MISTRMIAQTFVVSFLFLFVLFVVAIISYVIGEGNFKLEPVHAFIALVPLVVLLVLSGQLKEIGGPGGITLKLRDEVRKPVSPDAEELKMEIEPASVMDKGAVDDIPERIARELPTTLSFRIGVRGYYVDWAIEAYLRALEETARFRYVLFTNQDGQFRGAMKTSDFKDLLFRGNIIEMLETGDVLEARGIIGSTIEDSATYQQALARMEAAGVNSLAVVNGRNTFVGIISQEEVVRKILTRVLRDA